MGCELKSSRGRAMEEEEEESERYGPRTIHLSPLLSIFDRPTHLHFAGPYKKKRILYPSGENERWGGGGGTPPYPNAPDFLSGRRRRKFRSVMQQTFLPSSAPLGCARKNENSRPFIFPKKFFLRNFPSTLAGEKNTFRIFSPTFFPFNFQRKLTC